MEEPTPSRLCVCVCVCVCLTKWIISILPEQQLQSREEKGEWLSLYLQVKSPGASWREGQRLRGMFGALPQEQKEGEMSSAPGREGCVSCPVLRPALPGPPRPGCECECVCVFQSAA